MVEAADAMGFVKSSGDGAGERRNGALSWALHAELCDALSRRAAPLLPRAVCAHRGTRSNARWAVCICIPQLKS